MVCSIIARGGEITGIQSKINVNKVALLLKSYNVQNLIVKNRNYLPEHYNVGIMFIMFKSIVGIYLTDVNN